MHCVGVGVGVGVSVFGGARGDGWIDGWGSDGADVDGE